MNVQAAGKGIAVPGKDRRPEDKSFVRGTHNVHILKYCRLGGLPKMPIRYRTTDGMVKAVGTHHDLMRGSAYYERVATLQLIA